MTIAIIKIAIRLVLAISFGISCMPHRVRSVSAYDRIKGLMDPRNVLASDKG